MFACCLLAGRGHIHVDFHAAGNFNDLRGFPGHLGSPCKGDEFSTLDTKLARDEKFASEIFFPCKPQRVFVAMQQAATDFSGGRSKQKPIKGFISALRQGAVGKGRLRRWNHRIKNL